MNDTARPNAVLGIITHAKDIGGGAATDAECGRIMTVSDNDAIAFLIERRVVGRLALLFDR
jgi:hypothetical protein